MNGKISSGLTLDNYQAYFFVLGFDHNKDLEGGINTIHFQFGKSDNTAEGVNVAFVDDHYNQYDFTPPDENDNHYFRHHTTATNAGGALTGVFEKTPVPVNSFVLQNGGEGVGFYKVASTAIYANPFRAYLTAQAEARCLNIVFADEEEEVTGIQTVKVAKNNGVIFNLNGQRMNKLNKGLNIIGGKKLMVK